VICIVLAASLIVVIANGTHFSDKPNTSDLEKQVTNLNTQITSLQNQITNLNSIVSDYEEQIEDLVDINNYHANVIALEESMIILDAQTYTQDTPAKTVLFDDILLYAGYIEVQVESTSTTTYIQTSYTYENVKFNQTITVGTNGAAQFPILPGNIEILLCNTDTETSNTTVTMTYFY
jgi:hypothetical protein